MKIPVDGTLLRVFVGQQDKWQGVPLYEAIVHEARRQKLAGATVIKGWLGFGCKSHLHTAKLLESSEDMPMIIEIVDSDEKISAFIPAIDGMVKDGLVTTEKVNVVMYKAG